MLVAASECVSTEDFSSSSYDLKVGGNSVIGKDSENQAGSCSVGLCKK